MECVMRLTEIRIAGFGGQGVILSAIVLGKAASIYQGGFATMTQNFGPEARGGACSAQLILSDQPVLYPYVTRPDIMVVMSQEAYTRFAPELKDGGTADRRSRTWCACPICTGQTQGLQRSRHPPRRRTGQAHGAEFGDGGILHRRHASCSNADAVRKAVADSVPPSFRELNLKAFEKGFEYGNTALAGTAPRPGLEELAYSEE